MLFEDMLDTSDDVFGLALGELSGLGAAVEHWTIRSELWYGSKLLRIC